VKLRDYEEEWLSRINGSKSKRILVVGPTGSGKTVVAAAMIVDALKKGSRVLFIAHRIELIRQAKARLLDVGVPLSAIGLIVDREDESPGASVQIASVQTLARRRCPPADLILIDEAHHASSPSYKNIIEGYPGATVVGLTATPYRLDGVSLGEVLDEIVESAKPSVLIEHGWLSLPRVWTVPRHLRPSLSGVSVCRSDFRMDDLEEQVNKKALVGSIADHWFGLAGGRPTVCYSVNVSHGEAILQSLMSRGIRAQLITGHTKPDKRDTYLRQLSCGQLQIVVNCMVLTEGWDCPAARCAIVARPTLSQTLWFQMCGRVMRPGKTVPMILDHAGNALWLPLPGTDVDHSLTTGQDRPARFSSPPEKTCPSCGSTVGLGLRSCPNCGHQFWTAGDPEEIPGQLVEWKRACHYREAQPVEFKPLADGVRDEIVRLFAGGMSMTKIAKALGCDRTTVMYWTRRAGLEARVTVIPNQRGAEVVGMARQGMRPEEISAEIGLDVSSVRKRLRRAGVEIPRLPRPSPEWVGRAVELYSNGERTVQDISQDLSVSHKTVAFWLKRMGVRIRSSREQLGGLSDEQIDRVVTMHESGMSNQAIGKMHNLTGVSIGRYLKARWITPHSPIRDTSGCFVSK